MNNILTDDDYARIADEIIKILADNGATYREANKIMEYAYNALKNQKVSAPFD